MLIILKASNIKCKLLNTIIQEPRDRISDETLRFLILFCLVKICKDEIFYNDICLIENRKQG